MRFKAPAPEFATFLEPGPSIWKSWVLMFVSLFISYWWLIA